ncbi:hypothetical protein [Bradyrhizobium elkanii]|uniref:hypothetical protein n=1 Tax=Bradyrhizobium elkanii TaxID=29448 RepID=UPI003517BA11
MIQRRHVFHIGGYDPITPKVQVDRLRRSLSSFDKIWGASSRLSEISNTSAINASCNLEAWGPNWKTYVTFEMLRWDDLIRCDSGVGLVPRLVQSVKALFDFIVTGTLFKYAIASWKYALFFIFPYCCLLLIAFCSAGFIISGDQVHTPNILGRRITAWNSSTACHLRHLDALDWTKASDKSHSR